MYEGCETVHRDALRLQGNNPCNKVSPRRFHKASEITWKQLTSLLFIYVFIYSYIHFLERSGNNFVILLLKIPCSSVEYVEEK